VAKAKYKPAAVDEMERFYEHLERVLLRIGFLNPENPRLLMRRLRRLYNRARPDENEVNILRGILSATEQGVAER
jgi:tRNA C32,U32 (ribose-2'-O)-methylase TrmJ